MKATVANMQKLLDRSGQPIAVPGVVAYSPATGEECSSSPGDYFYLNDRDCLKDSEGNPMILARRVSTIVALRDFAPIR